MRRQQPHRIFSLLFIAITTGSPHKSLWLPPSFSLESAAYSLAILKALFREKCKKLSLTLKLSVVIQYCNGFFIRNCFGSSAGPFLASFMKTRFHVLSLVDFRTFHFHLYLLIISLARKITTSSRLNLSALIH